MPSNPKYEPSIQESPEVGLQRRVSTSAVDVDVPSPAPSAHRVRSILGASKLAYTRLMSGIAKAGRKLRRQNSMQAQTTLYGSTVEGGSFVSNQSSDALAAQQPARGDLQDAETIVSDSPAPPVYIPPLPTLLRDIFGPLSLSASNDAPTLVLGCSPRPPYWRRSSVFSVFPREASASGTAVVAPESNGSVDVPPAQTDSMATVDFAAEHKFEREERTTTEFSMPTMIDDSELASRPVTVLPSQNENEDVPPSARPSETHALHSDADADTKPGTHIVVLHGSSASDDDDGDDHTVPFLSLIPVLWRRFVTVYRGTPASNDDVLPV